MLELRFFVCPDRSAPDQPFAGNARWPERIRTNDLYLVIPKMRVAQTSSHSVLGSIYAGLMAIADHSCHCCYLQHNCALRAGYVTTRVTEALLKANEGPQVVEEVGRGARI